MLVLRTLLLHAAAALVLVATSWHAPASVDARMIPWSPDLRTSMSRRHNSMDTLLQKRYEAAIHDGRFPYAGRSLEAKIREANAFLDRELGNRDIAGVGVSAAIVYNDQVVISKGYGLRQSNDSTSHVTTSTLFQIGSVTKTFIAVAFAILVDEGKVAWHDPVIKHLPALQLVDKYAQQTLTIGDLLDMNSGLGGLLDVSLMFGLYPTDKDAVAALANAPPAHALRSQYEYANSNFAILGEVLEYVSGVEWDAFLQERIWTPLNMTRTFASASDARADRDMSSGHLACGGDVLGPFDLVLSPEAQLVAGTAGNKLAAGSVVSSSDDMAKLLRLLLNKGSVDGVTIVRSPVLITDMTSGKSIVSGDMVDMFVQGGHQYTADGDTLAAGYGIDFISHAIWGRAYYDKSGDTVLHQTRTGFSPGGAAPLGVIVMANSQLPTPHGNYIIDHVRSYVMGIFLDVPTDMLERAFAQWRAADALKPVLPHTPVCGLAFWKERDVPDLPLNATEAQAIVGTYVVPNARAYFGSIELTLVDNATPRLHLRAHKFVAQLRLIQDVGDAAQTKLFATGIGASMGIVQLTKDPSDGGKYTLNFAVDFKQQ